MKRGVDAGALLEKVRAEKPLVHHITNWVTIYDCANVVRMVGGLPVMAHAIEESAEMQGISSALVLNIGTLTLELVDSMIAAAKEANAKKHPVVLDVVGAGATKLRNEKALEILGRVRVDILKGNKSEIAKMAGEDVSTRGVESGAVPGDIAAIAKALARKYSNTVAVTGKEDVVASAAHGNYIVRNGHALMGEFVGTGCMAASVIGCFAAVERDYAAASAAALSCYGIAGELAARKADAPGAFKQHLLDALYRLDSATVRKMQKIEEF
ncbi:MAG: hydroxyethylthiazole kinase [Candidatus Diapherotrites archaeon]|nr:hydroxyethylthiazole kinase [Candidatus Diapherotrites archaeon]